MSYSSTVTQLPPMSAERKAELDQLVNEVKAEGSFNEKRSKTCRDDVNNRMKPQLAIMDAELMKVEIEVENQKKKIVEYMMYIRDMEYTF